MVRWYMEKKRERTPLTQKESLSITIGQVFFFFFWLVYKTRMDDATCLSDDSCLFPCFFVFVFVCYWLYQNDIFESR